MDSDPSQRAELEPWLRLALAPRVGPKLAHLLIQKFGSPAQVFNSSRSELLATPGIGPAVAESLLSSRPDQAISELDLAEKTGVHFVTFADPAYSAGLRQLASPPIVLWVRGNLLPQDQLGLAVVGPRSPSDYARAMTRSLIPPLCARGVTVVSGMAFGVDAEAHQAAIAVGGRTLAVPGQGLATPLHPSSNRDLANRIVREDQGALISIFPLQTPPIAGNFPQRNEIMAALTLGTLVVEAGDRSGALITAGHCAELGRTVFACPGDATRPGAQGSNRLLAEGATLVQNSQDLLDGLAPELRRVMQELQGEGEANSIGQAESDGSDGSGDTTSRPDASLPQALPFSPLDPLGEVIRNAILSEGRPIDYILETCANEQFDQSEVIQKLLELEISGVIERLPGRVYAIPSSRL